MLRRGLFALVLVGAAFSGGAAINGPGLAWLQRTFLSGQTIIVDGPPSDPAASKKPLKQFPTAKTSALVVDLPRPPEPKKKARPAPVEPVVDPASPLESSPPGLALPLPKNDPTARVASLEPPLPMPVPSVSTSTSTSTDHDWLEIRKRMKSMGVTRYTLEADTEGRVRFTCLIPVDGLRAIGHQFEAEGDDEYQAADSALKRVALWQATESR